MVVVMVMVTVMIVITLTHGSGTVFGCGDDYEYRVNRVTKIYSAIQYFHYMLKPKTPHGCFPENNY